MATCAQYQTMLVDYADGHLNDFDRQRVDAHLAGCPACQSQLAGERWLSSRLHEAADDWPVEQLLAWPARPVAPRPRRLRRCVLATAALAALVTVVFCFRPPTASIPETIASRSATEEVSANDDRQFADLKAAIGREACAAELAMSAELLATEPAAESYAAEALRFVADTFPETKAGRDAARQTGLSSPFASEPL